MRYRSSSSSKLISQPSISGQSGLKGNAFARSWRRAHARSSAKAYVASVAHAASILAFLRS
eukprot:5963064-Lingulodinium_polyedra.AAC.1